jgi:hypothetical protein
MSDQNKGKPSKSVMGNLPSTRPTRMGRRRDGEPAGDGEATPTPAAPKRTPAAAKSKAKPAAAKPTRATPKAVGKPATKAGPKPTATARASAPKPRAVRSGSPSLDAAKKQSTAGRRREPAASPPKGAELVTTAVQATGELAKIGLTLGGQALKRAVDRLPKP